jgi:hypothetical protein
MPLSPRYVAKAKVILESRARIRGRPIFYSELANELGIHALAVGGVLQPLNEETYTEHGRLLSVLVVSKENHIPSGEFFQQARRLGAMATDELPQEFFKSELLRVYDAYSKEQE